jgi:hypothetical protein
VADNISKNCTRCGKSKKIAKDFYMNRDHVSGNMVDNWCKSCTQTYCIDQETLKIYCQENLRKFSEELWENANRLAVESFENDEKYAKATTQEKQEMLASRTIKLYFKQQSQSQYYIYMGSNVAQNNNNIEVDSNLNIVKLPKETFVYNTFWDGEYTQAEINEMNDSMEQYKNTYELNPYDLSNVKFVIQLFTQIQRLRKEIVKGSKTAVAELQKIYAIYQKTSEDLRLTKKQRGVLDGSDGRNSFTQMQDDLEKLGYIPKSYKRIIKNKEFELLDGCYDKDELDKLLECNNQMLADIFYGVGYDEKKYETILGMNTEGADKNGKN